MQIMIRFHGIFFYGIFTIVGWMGSVVRIFWDQPAALPEICGLGVLLVRSTSKSRPNNIRGGKMSVRPYVRPSTKSFFDLNEIWYIGRGR